MKVGKGAKCSFVKGHHKLVEEGQEDNMVMNGINSET